MGQMRGLEQSFAHALAQRLRMAVTWCGSAPFGALWVVGPFHSSAGPCALSPLEGVNRDSLDAMPGLRLRAVDRGGRLCLMCYIGRKTVGRGNVRAWNQSQRAKVFYARGKSKATE